MLFIQDLEEEGMFIKQVSLELVGKEIKK